MASASPSRAWRFVIAAAVFGVGSCKDRSAAPVALAPSDHDLDDEIQAVYPIDNRPPLPIAETYCHAVQERVRLRREACCPGSGAFSATAECVRTLSAALRSGAVILDETAVRACVVAMAAATEGCGWVGPTGNGTIPTACSQVIKGALKSGAKCRSNLECPVGFRCHGLGATRPGRCGAADDLHACNISTDSLATFTAQYDFERYHPACSGSCVGNRCFPAAPIGAPCTASSRCGARAWCIAGNCSQGALPERGAACTDVCAEDTRCVQGKCFAPKSEGETCERDSDCRVHCERASDGSGGRCARQCPSVLIPPVNPPAARAEKR
jgi:hypothetical protein